MKKIILILAGISFAPLCHAEGEYGMATTIGVGINHLKFVNRSGKESVADYGTLNIGLAAFYKVLYGSFNAELFGYDIDVDKIDSAQTEEMHRNEYSLTVGVSATKSWRIYAGYAVSRTVFDRGGVIRLHKDRGPFVGTGYGFVLGTGTLGLNIAYAKFDGEIRAGDGETTGYSYGISWSDKYTDNSNIVIGLKIKNYLFSLDDSTDKTEKDLTSLTIAYQF